MAHLFAFFCGGSGTRVAETYALCAAMGLMRNDVPTHICICDADHENGNTTHSFDTIGDYINVHKAMYPNSHTAEKEKSFFGNTITALEKWSLDGRDKVDSSYCLNDLCEGGASDRIKGALFDEQEQKEDIKHLGFFAHPNVGNVFVQAAILREQDVESESKSTAYKRTKKEIMQQLDAGDTVYVVFVGSLFGGTGAACIPTIAKDLYASINKSYSAGGKHDEKKFDQVFHMAAVMLLPYFTLPLSGNRKDEKVKASKFNTSAKVAVDYYYNKHPDLFEVIYPIGLPTSYVLPGKAEYGGSKQENPSSLVEWVSALAIRHFIDNHNTSIPRPTQSVLCCACLKVDENNKYVLSADSFMNSEFKDAFIRWNDFASFYALYLYPNIRLGNSGSKDVANWYKNYINTDSKNPAIESLFSFVKTYYASLGDLIGLSLSDGAQPINMLVNADNLTKLYRKEKNEKGDDIEFGTLSMFTSEQEITPPKVKKAYKALKDSFDIPQSREKHKNKPNDLEKVVISKRNTAGDLGQLLRSVADALQTNEKE